MSREAAKSLIYKGFWRRVRDSNLKSKPLFLNGFIAILPRKFGTSSKTGHFFSVLRTKCLLKRCDFQPFCIDADGIFLKSDTAIYTRCGKVKVGPKDVERSSRKRIATELAKEQLNKDFPDRHIVELHFTEGPSFIGQTIFESAQDLIDFHRRCMKTSQNNSPNTGLDKTIL